MNKLQQLHGELDVPQTTGTQLDLDVPLDGRNIVRHSLAHSLHRLDESIAARTRPGEFVYRAQVPLTQVRIAREWTCLEQSLKFPVFSPPLVIDEVGLKRADKGAFGSFGAQVGVQLPQWGFTSRFRRCLDNRASPFCRQVNGITRIDVNRIRHEDHVDVGQVVELSPTRFSHPDDSESGPRDEFGRCLCVALCAYHRRRQHRAREIRQCFPDAVDNSCRVWLSQIPRRNCDEVLAIAVPNVINRVDVAKRTDVVLLGRERIRRDHPCESIRSSQ